MTASRLSRAVASFSAAAVLLGTLSAVPAAAVQDPAIDARPVAPASTASRPVPAAAAGRFVVRFKAGAPGAASARAKAYGQAARSAGISVKELRATATGGTVVQASEELTPGERAGILAALRAQANVESAEVDTFVRPAATPNDPLYPKQWDLFEATAGMRVPAAWDMTSGLGTVVAVIDTGITPHSDLSQVLPGYDFISDSGSSNDGDGRDGDATDAGDYCEGEPSSWHGTHVAGTIAAAANNGLGIAGVAYSSSILPVRALGACGGYLSDIADGVVWAAGGAVSGVPASDHRAKVINLSLSGSGQCSAYFQSALDFAAAQGVAVVAAAGNESLPASDSTPANCNNVITVGATGREGNLARYSNYGPEVDVSAPGGDGSTGGANTILSTWNDGATVPGAGTYGYMQGTSMAAPHVAGAAALIMTANRGLAPAQVEEILRSTARPLPGTCAPGGCGAGLVDAGAAVRAANPDWQQPAPGPTVAGAPSVQGAAKVGSVLAADPGSWAPNTTFSFQWHRGGAAIDAATARSYTVGAADLGQILTVAVTGARDGYDSATAVSAPTAAVAAGTLTAPTPLVNGTRKVGYALSAAPGTWTAGTALKYQWYRSGIAITGATGYKYTLAAADLGRAMRVRVTGTKPGYTTAARYSGTTSPVAAGTLTAGRPWMAGYARFGYTLTANPGTWTSGTAFRYQWYRSGVAIPGATGRYYRIVWADRYDTLSVRVVGSKAGYTTAVRYSGATARIR